MEAIRSSRYDVYDLQMTSLSQTLRRSMIVGCLMTSLKVIRSSVCKCLVGDSPNTTSERRNVSPHAKCHCCPILIKIIKSKQILEKLPHIKFHERSFSCSRVYTCDRRMDGRAKLLAKTIKLISDVMTTPSLKIPM